MGNLLNKLKIIAAMTTKDIKASIKEDAKMPATGKLSAKAEQTASESKNGSLSKSVKLACDSIQAKFVVEVRGIVSDAKQLKQYGNFSDDAATLQKKLDFAKEITNNFSCIYTQTKEANRQKLTPKDKVLIYGTNEFYLTTELDDKKNLAIQNVIDVAGVLRSLNSALNVWQAKQSEAKKVMERKAMTLEALEAKLIATIGKDAFATLTKETKQAMLEAMKNAI